MKIRRWVPERTLRAYGPVENCEWLNNRASRYIWKIDKRSLSPYAGVMFNVGSLSGDCSSKKVTSINALAKKKSSVLHINALAKKKSSVLHGR